MTKLRVCRLTLAVGLALPAITCAQSVPQPALLTGQEDHGSATNVVTTATELAGNSLAVFPFFEYVRAFNQGSTVRLAIDPSRFPAVVGRTGRVYVTTNRTWAVGDVITDVRGSFQTVTFSGSTIQANTFALTGTLAGPTTTAISQGYDLVVDLNSNGLFDNDDFVDGASAAPGFSVIRNLVNTGPLATAAALDYTVSGVTSGFERQRTVYPASIATLGRLPLVIISHGNGHQYTWYDYLQQHLASYGYVVMSHQNNTVPGIESCSLTTLQHTDAFLGSLSTIGGGVLNGRVDSSRITWIGHSRGGEGVARAYDRIFDGTFLPVRYSLADIRVISSIAPTDFLGTNSSNPHGVTYHLLYGSADGDVCGCPSSDVAQSFIIYERATGTRQSTYIQGADHNDFNCCGFDDFTGPSGTAIGRTEAQRVARASYLALVKRYIENDHPAKDFFWRQYENIRPLGVASSVIVDNEYKDGTGAARFVIDDFQVNSSTTVSSSGAAVGFNVANLSEGILNDNNTSFTWTTSDPFNGMTRARTTDTTRGIVFDFNTDNRFIEWTVPAAGRNFAAFDYFSVRACQGTRHPETTALIGDASFTVTLRDSAGVTASIRINAYGGGLEEPYQRTSFGTGAGWQNEFETIRIRLTDFLHNGTNLNLSNIAAVRFSFGASWGSSRGRFGIDDVEVVRD